MFFFVSFVRDLLIMFSFEKSGTVITFIYEMCIMVLSFYASHTLPVIWNCAFLLGVNNPRKVSFMYLALKSIFELTIYSLHASSAK